jgi:hypothetical protein
MDYLRILWKWRLLILVAALGSWIWYEDDKATKLKIEEEKRIAAQLEEKKRREQALFEEYQKRKNNSKCQIKYEVTLETFGATVNVELRAGVVGDSFPLVIKQASDGKIHYSSLCPGKYFLAIGDDKNVSTTPVQDFAAGNTYTSRVHLTKGVGNMGSARRELL